VKAATGEQGLPVFMEQTEAAKAARAYVRLAAFLARELDVDDLPRQTASRYRFQLACLQSRLGLQEAQEAP